MQKIVINSHELSKIVLSCKRSATTSLLQYAVTKGINAFEVSEKFPEIEQEVATFIADKSAYIIASGESSDISRFTLPSKKLIYFVKMNSFNLDIITQLQAKCKDSTTPLLAFGVRTHSKEVAKQCMLSNVKLLQIPSNPVENGLFLSLKELIQELAIKPFLIKPLGSGEYFEYTPTLLIGSLLSYTHGTDSIFCATLKNETEIDFFVDTMKDFDMSMIYPIVNTLCNNCQDCDVMCSTIKKYPLSKLVRYARYSKSMNPDIAAWACKKYIESIMEFNCEGCSACEDSCHMKLPIRRYITSISC